MKRLIIATGLTVLSLMTASVSTVNAQTTSQNTTVRGTGTYLNYPSGTQIYTNGGISVPNQSTIIYPATTINNSDGSKTYYYSNGTQVNAKTNSINPSGTYLLPGSSNLNNPYRLPNPNYGRY
jgi:hypothetical protein